MSPRLSRASLPALPPAVRRPAFVDIDRVSIGIVHIGPGAFHRAHQASFIDDVLAREPDWAISAVSLNTTGVRDALVPQDGLYALVSLGRTAEVRVIGAIREVLHAPGDPVAVLTRLAAPSTRIVTLTVTEKGYGLGPDGHLDLGHPAIVRDLAEPRTPSGVIGYLVEGLRHRRAAGLPPYTVISCDNLADNGRKLGRAVADFARRLDPDLASWIEGEGAFPCTMVDSITPATDDALRQRVAAALGVADAWPVQREPFTQWVVEDRFCAGRPDLAAAGVQLTTDVAAFDRAKLRLLNGPHSTLAYLGLLLGAETVAESMAIPELAGFVDRFARADALPTLTAPPGFDLDRYVADILERFRNPGIRHQLSQIAWDGSQKLPVRILGTVADLLAAGRPIDRPCLTLAAWFIFLRGRARPGAPALVDPLADTLLDVAGRCTGDAEADMALFLERTPVFTPALRTDPRFRTALSRAYRRLGDGTAADVRSALADALSGA